MKRLAFLFSSVALLSCFDPNRVLSPTSSWENNERTCANGYDDNYNGLIDCEDPGCIAANLCGEIVPLLPPSGSERSARECSDGVDNDRDGQYDCGDRDCQSVRELCCSNEFDNASCSDGIDNDLNGFADCADFGCRQSLYVTVCSRETACGDGRDNDNDSRIDCADSDCFIVEGCFTPEDEHSLEACSDGRDNDGNTYQDCADRGCTDQGRGASAEAVAYCASLAENSLEACSDGDDNDRNGFLDCADFSCTRADRGASAEAIAHCASAAEDTYALCTDGLDNDGDGFTDCNDRSCLLSYDERTDPPEVVAERRRLAALCEADFATCKDGIDNDGDTFTDCSDRSCSSLKLTFAFPDGSRRTISPCSESVETPGSFATSEAQANAVENGIRNCTDGEDGDGDGFFDCDDWDCQWNPLLNPYANGQNTPGLCQGGRWDRPSLSWQATDAPLTAARPLLCR